MIEPSLGALLAVWRLVAGPFKRGVLFMLAWFKLFRNAPENLAIVERHRALAARWAEVDEARARGYPVCHCTRPQTIMALSPVPSGTPVWKCPACGSEHLAFSRLLG